MWEEGHNRICDPEFLGQDGDEPNQRGPLVDKWERFTVTFSIYMPVSDVSTAMRINGGTEQLGDWNKGSGSIKMGLGSARKWLTGETVKPWELKEVRYMQS